MKDIHKPLVSIITVTYNCKDEIKATIESILAMKLEFSFEYIVIDGLSTDGTLELIGEYLGEIDLFVSESDSGIYDAMNKGWDLSNGEYILFVNAGDILLYLPIKRLIYGIERKIDLVCGIVKTDGGNKLIPKYDKSLKFRNTLPHQGLFYNRALEIRFDLNYRVFSDFDLNQRLYKSEARFINIEHIICIHNTGGISHNPFYFKEVYHVIKKNYGKFFVFKAFVYHKIQGLKHKINQRFL